MVYIYYCPDCNEYFNLEFGMEEDHGDTRCGKCGGLLRRVYTAPPILYKGTGWTGAGHGVPDMDEREKLPGPLQFDDLLEN